MYICPHCNGGIDTVDYKILQTEYGYVNLPDTEVTEVEDNLDDWNSTDTNSQGDYEYSCPLCENALNLTDLRWESPATPGDVIPNATQRAIIDEQETIRPAFVGVGRRNQFDVTMICMKPSCKKPFIYDKDSGRFFECPHCHFNNDKLEFERKIRQGDYNLEKRNA